MNAAAAASFATNVSTVDAVRDGAALGAARGVPQTVLRLEGLVALAAGVVAYAHLRGTWGWFAVLFLLPDLSMLGYLAGRRVGAAAYNAGHSYVGAGLLALAGFATHAHAAVLFAAIWVAHIGFDRALGYGLKYAIAFGDTHLGAVGRGR